jgi:hypothetical protein
MASRFRIVKRGDRRFLIQRKILWFWETCKDIYGVPIFFYSEEEAAEVIEAALRPDEVVKEF